MLVVEVQYLNRMPRIVGPFNSLNDAYVFEDELIASIQAKNEFAPYIQPCDGWYEADFNSDHQPLLPIRIKLLNLMSPSEFSFENVGEKIRFVEE